MSDNPYYGGGGFMSPMGSTNGSPGGAKRSGQHSVRPVTIMQLHRATQSHADAEWIIDDFEASQITLVARVLSAQQNATNRQYFLDDGTGKIEARRWTDASSDPDETDVQDDDLVRVTGQLKVYNGKRYLTATQIRKVTDFHELFFHTLEAMTITLILERGPPPRPGEHPAPANSKAAHPSTASAYTAQTGQTATHDQFAHLPPKQRQIVEFILAQPAHEDGVHVAAIARAIGGDASSISDALDKLMDDGQVYTTIDESHFNVSI